MQGCCSHRWRPNTAGTARPSSNRRASRPDCPPTPGACRTRASSAFRQKCLGKEKPTADRSNSSSQLTGKPRTFLVGTSCDLSTESCDLNNGKYEACNKIDLIRQ